MKTKIEVLEFITYPNPNFDFFRAKLVYLKDGKKYKIESQSQREITQEDLLIEIYNYEN